MSAAILFSIADELRSFRDKADVIELLAQELSSDGDLRARVAAWKDMDPEEIRATLKGKLLAGLQEKLPAKYQFLLKPVSELDDHLIDLGDWSKEDATTLAPVKVTASASGSIELDGVLDEDLTAVLEGPVPAGTVLFTVSISGKIGIAASGKAATPLVSLSVAASGSRAQTLAVGFLRDADQPVLLELMRVRDYFVRPSDLHEVMGLFADSSARLIQHHYEGAHSLGLKIALEKNLASALRELIPNPALTPSGKGEMSLSVSVKNTDDFLLTIERDTASSAFVRLERKTTRERARIFKLGVSVEIKGLKDQIVNRIGELLPDSPDVKEALAKLDDLVDKVDGDGLHELIGGALAARFDDHSELFQALFDNTPIEDIKAQLLDELTGTLVARINERVNVLSDDASAAANSIAVDLAAGLALDAAAAQKLSDFLAASTKSALSSLQEKLDKKIAALNTDAADELKAILAPLAKADKAVKDALANVGQTTAKALKQVKAGIQTVYGKYTAFRQKLIELVNERVTEQAAFAFVGEKTQTVTGTTLIAFRILDADATGVADLYNAIWSRRLDDAWDLMQAAEASAGIRDLEGSYVSVLKNQRRATVSLDLFGLKVGTDVMFSDEVTLGVDHTGKLIVAKNQAEFRARRHLGSESQTLTAEWSFDFLGTDADPTLVPPIKISVDLSDKKFDKDDLRDFFDSLNKLGCVKLDAFDSVGTELLGGVSSAKRLEDVSLGLVVALSWNDLAAILGANLDGTPRADKWDGAAVGAQIFEAIRRGHRRGNFFEDLDRAASREGREPLALLLELGRTLASKIKRDTPKLMQYRAVGKSLNLLDKRLDELQTKWPTLLAELRALGGPASVKRRQEMIAEVDNQLRAVLVALFLSNTFAAFPDLSEVWQVASAARVLLDRAGRDHLLLTMEGPRISRRIVA